MVTEEVYSQLAQLIGTDNVARIAGFTGMTTQSTIIWVAVLLAAIFIWSLVWKGLALWKAALRKEKIWFIVILIVSTYGILEILYIYVFSRIEWNKNQRTNQKQKVKIKSVKKKTRGK
jgi:hypothetical protein